MTPEGPIVAIDHVYYWTRDMDRAVAFYETILSLPVSRRAGNEWAEFQAEGIRLALHGTEEALDAAERHRRLPRRGPR
jgi:catechol 2,3-dioxygenase-like lactoylglutathione lyase family enzyme